MIEQALVEHLKAQETLTAFLTTYGDAPAIFNQEAPADSDPLWADGAQYGRVVFAEDMEGDPERTMGGRLTVDIMCKENLQYPEEIEPVLRGLIDGYFFSSSSGTFTVAAQWKDSSYFTEPTDQVTGCTMTFELLAFPILTTTEPDIVERLNEWTAQHFNGLHVINYDEFPGTWKPTEDEAAIYWRVLQSKPATWIRSTYQTEWRTATVRGHVFAVDASAAGKIARTVINELYTSKRLVRKGESQIMTNSSNSVDFGADALRTGQITVDGTYGVIVYHVPNNPMNHINVISFTISCSPSFPAFSIGFEAHQYVRINQA